MDNLMNSFMELRKRWTNLNLLVKPYLNYGSNRCLELVLICAGVHPIPGPELWKRNCLILYRLLGFYQFVVTLTRATLCIYYQEDLLELCGSMLLVVFYSTSLVKVYTLGYFREVVRQSKTSVNSNLGHSGDPGYDASVRKEAADIVGKINVLVFVLFWCNQALITLPNDARDRVIGIPNQFRELGPTAARFLQEMYIFMLAVFWGNRYFCYSLTVLPLLMGLRSELLIVARGFATIQTRVEDQILDDLENEVGSSRKPLPHVLKWKHLQRILGTTVEQHVNVLRIMQLIQNLVSVHYAITYYSSMMIISITTLVAIKGGITFMALAFLLAAIAFIAECYLWCHLIASIEGIMESITESAGQLSCELEHSSEYHSEYTQMRTSLMIIQLNSAKEEWFTCGGIFPISVESFGDLCMIIYRFITFLLNSE